MRYAAIVLLAAALGLAACSGSSDNSQSGNASTGSISVLLNWGASSSALQSSTPFGPIPKDVLAIGLSLSGTDYVNSLSIGVAEGAYTFYSVPVGTGYSLTVTTVAAGDVITCTVTVSSIDVIGGQTTQVTADLSTCVVDVSQGTVAVTWGEGALVVGAAAVSGTVPLNYSLYYYFGGTASTAYTITLTPSTGNPDLALYSSAWLEIIAPKIDSSSNTGTSVDSILYTPLTTQRYYVQVTGADTTSTFTIGITAQ